MNRILEVCLVAAALTTTIPASAAGIKVATDATAQALQRGISVQLATASNATPMPEADNQNTWIVTVTASGDMDFGIDPVSPAALADVMKSRPRNREQKLYIKADANAPFSKVAQVLKVARSVMFETSVLLTSPSHAAAPGTNVQRRRIGSTARRTGRLAPDRSAGHPFATAHTDFEASTIEQIPWANLQNMLTQFFQAHPEKVVLLKADDQLPFADVVHVIDTCAGSERKSSWLHRKLSSAAIPVLVSSDFWRDRAGILTFSIDPSALPNMAGVLRHHRLPRLAAPRLLKLRHVLDHAVHAILPRRMRIGQHPHARHFRTPLLAPHSPES